MIKTNIRVPVFHLALLPAISAVAILVSSCVIENPEKSKKTPFPHSDNVFAEAKNWYVNDLWSRYAEADGESFIAKQSTAVWLKSIGDIETVEAGTISGIPGLQRARSPKEGFGLREHLQAAETQGNALLQLVIYNLPGRDCGGDVHMGELPASPQGMAVYREHFIDRIVRILKDFPHIPVAAIIEPSALSDLVLSSKHELCELVNNQSPYGYVNGVRYSVNALSELTNVHIYLDAGNSAKLGWDDTLQMSSLFTHGVINGFDGLQVRAQIAAEKIESEPGATGLYSEIAEFYVEPSALQYADVQAPGYGKVDGFITNVADYVPLDEPFLDDPRVPEGPNPLRSAVIYDWNPRVDEWTYSRDWMSALVDEGLDIAHLGMLIDTSRNGWGQSMAKREEAQITQDPTLVDDYRLDQRSHRRSWCNQSSGIGKRPQANPDDKDWIDAYVWVMAPGESDGIAFGPGDPRWVQDPNAVSRQWSWEMCDPNGSNRYAEERDSTKGRGVPTGAMPNAPWRGEWFSEGFKTLIKNAWPKKCLGKGDVCE